MKDGKIIGVDIIVDVLSHYAHDGWNFKYDDHSGKPQYLKDNIVIYPPFVLQVCGDKLIGVLVLCIWVNKHGLIVYNNNANKREFYVKISYSL